MNSGALAPSPGRSPTCRHSLRHDSASPLSPLPGTRSPAGAGGGQGVAPMVVTVTGHGDPRARLSHDVTAVCSLEVGFSALSNAQPRRGLCFHPQAEPRSLVLA